VPRTVLPLVESVLRRVAPETVRVLAVPVMATLLVKVARPVLSMVSRSVSWPLPVLVLPVALVLKIKLPPSLPVASCNTGKSIAEVQADSQVRLSS